MSSETPAVTLERVSDRAGMRRFVAVEAVLGAALPHFVPPLRQERMAALSARSNPYFAHAEAAFWLAHRGSRPVGRISAQEDRLAPPGPNGDRPGHWGLLTAENDPAAIAALLGAAEGWLRERGLRRAIGPFSLSINEQSGLLVRGHDTPPMLMMPHDAPHLGPVLEELGHRPATDLLAYRFDPRRELPRGPRGLLARGLPAGVTLRPLRMRDYRAEVGRMVAIFNDAWADNWGFVPMTPAELDHMAAQLRPLIRERLVWFAEVHGEPVAFLACLPNLNEAIRDLDGRLLPLGWARLLWRLRVSGVRSGRVPLMGVRRSQSGVLAALLPFHLIDATRREAVALGMEEVELSWVLESNLPMRRIAEALGADPYKTYRLYEKALAA